MRINVRTLTNRSIDIDVDPTSTVGDVLQKASDVEHCSWRPGEYHKDVVLVHRRTFRRYVDVEQPLGACGIRDGDALELTIRFAAQPSVNRLQEPVGFYMVEPAPASTNVPLNAPVIVHMVNVAVEGRRCLSLRPAAHPEAEDDDGVPCSQEWVAPNELKLVPSRPLLPNTAYTVKLDLSLDVKGVRVLASDGLSVTCVADGVDTARPCVFVWGFETGATAGPSAAPAGPTPGGAEPAIADVVQGLLARPLDGCSKKQLLSLQHSLGCLMDRVTGAISHIDHKIDTINRRLQEKARLANGADRPQPNIEQALKKLRQS